MSFTNNILNNIPNKTGVYQYFDENQNLIYIGKAKNLKTRVYSYFSKDQKNKKTKNLVSKIRNIKYILVKTELDALLLENNLIKKHKPKYNILLKDDKSYPWICIKNEPFPRGMNVSAPTIGVKSGIRAMSTDRSEFFIP